MPYSGSALTETGVDVMENLMKDLSEQSPDRSRGEGESMSALAVDIMIEEIIYEATINVRKYAQAILNLSRIGNIKGAEYFKTKLACERNTLRILRNCNEV